MVLPLGAAPATRVNRNALPGLHPAVRKIPTDVSTNNVVLFGHDDFCNLTRTKSHQLGRKCTLGLANHLNTC